MALGNGEMKSGRTETQKDSGVTPVQLLPQRYTRETAKQNYVEGSERGEEEDAVGGGDGRVRASRKSRGTGN